MLLFLIEVARQIKLFMIFTKLCGGEEQDKFVELMVERGEPMNSKDNNSGLIFLK